MDYMIFSCDMHLVQGWQLLLFLVPVLERLLTLSLLGVGHMGHALLWRQITNQNFTIKIWQIKFSSEIILWIFLLRCPFKKVNLCLFSYAKAQKPKM
jgi:hypothetical protein